MTTTNLGLSATVCSLLVGFTGCDKPSKATPGHALPSPPMVSACEPGIPGGRLVLTTPGSLRTFNPLIAFDTASDNVVRLIHGSLLTLDWVTQEPRAGLAESWAVAADQKTWTFKLRRGLRWSDGTPLTADDVVFTWTQVMYDPQINRATYDLFRMDGKSFQVRNIDDTTVEVITPQPFAPFLEFFGVVPILPRHVLEHFVKQNRFLAAYGTGTPPARIVGCGPYRVKEISQGKFTLLERNPEYWVTDKQGRRLPYLNEIMINAGGPPGGELLILLAAKCDALDSVRPEAYSSLQQAAAAGNLRVLEPGIGAERDFLWFNLNTGTKALGKPIVNPARLKWFRQKKFRQAVSCGINRERLVHEVYNGRAVPSLSFISTENVRWHNPRIPLYGYDTNRARALLAEIGMRDANGDGFLEDTEGATVEFDLLSNTGNALREKSAALIQQDLRSLGIKVNYSAIEFRQLVEKINNVYDYECALMGLGGGGLDPASQINVLRSSEDLHQWFPRQARPSTEWEAKIDSLMESQMRTLDFTSRKQSFDEVQAILAEEMPMIYTVSPLACAAIRSDVGNVRPAAMTPYKATWNIEELFFQPARK